MMLWRNGPTKPNLESVACKIARVHIYHDQPFLLLSSEPLEDVVVVFVDPILEA